MVGLPGQPSRLGLGPFWEGLWIYGCSAPGWLGCGQGQGSLPRLGQLQFLVTGREGDWTEA